MSLRIFNTNTYRSQNAGKNNITQYIQMKIQFSATKEMQIDSKRTKIFPLNNDNLKNITTTDMYE